MRATQFLADLQADRIKTAQFLANLHAAEPTPTPATSDTDADSTPDETIRRADGDHWALREKPWALRETHWGVREAREFLRRELTLPNGGAK